MFVELVKKVSKALITLWVVATLTFFLMKLLPGSPFSYEQSLPPEVEETLKNSYGLNDHWTTQYFTYLKSIVTLNLGPSLIFHDRSVNSIIMEAFPVSALLAFQTLALTLPLGIGVGAMAAVYEKGWQDRLFFILATLGMSIPSFILATLLQYSLSIQCGLCPIARWGTWSHTILPTIALGALPLIFLARLIRSSTLETLGQDYIKTARAKGLSAKAVLFKHALRNSVLPSLPYLGQMMANIMVGSFVIEKIFSIPGLGAWFVNSISNRDYTVIMGLTVFYSAILLTLLIIVDMLYYWLDPRTRARN